MSPRLPGARRASRAMGVAGVFLALVVVRVVTASSAELAEGDRMRAAGELDAAVVHYRRAARWYVPASPLVGTALDRIEAIALRAEAEGDAARALAAHRAIRAAILSTRSFYTPNRARLRVANEHIASLMAAQDPPPIDAGKSRDAIRREHLELLSADPGPSLPFTVLLLVGFFAWVTGSFALAARAFDDEDRIVLPEARRWGAVVVGGLVLFVVGLAFA